MLLIAAKVILTVAATFFVILGSIALIQPENANRFLLGFATSALKHYAELTVRILVGAAMLIVAFQSRHPFLLIAFGWILIITTAIMVLVPWRAHRKFAEAAVPKALRFLPIIGMASLAIGGLLLWNIFIASTPYPRI